MLDQFLNNHRLEPEKQAGDNAQLLATVALHTRDIVIITSSDTKILWANQAFVDATGYELQEIIGKTPGSILQGPDTNPRARLKIREAIEARKSVRTEILNYRKNGDPYWLDIEISPVFSSSGELIYFIAVERDITQAKNDEASKRNLYAYQEALDQQAIVSVADRKGHITFVNDNFCKISGFEREELIGANHRIVNSNHHERAFFDDMWQTISKGGSWHGEVCNRTKSGAQYWVDTTIVPVKDKTGRPERYVSIRYDVTKRKQFENELKTLAEQDVLTNLANRKVLVEALERAQDTTEITNKEVTGALFLIDLDHFKDINDTLGHDVGDKMLLEIAARLRKLTRKNDTVARLGGDEFAVVAQRINGTAGCTQLAERLHHGLSKTIHLENQTIEPSCSIGVTQFPLDGCDPMSLLKNADIAMYEAKGRGRGQWSFFDANVSDALAYKTQLLRKLRKALYNEELTIHLQPQFCLNTGKHCGFEALARWCHDGKMIPPDKFVSIAEESGLIVPLGEQILRKSLKVLRDMLDKGLEPTTLSINVSPPQLRSEGFVDVVKLALEEFNIDPTHICFELTETAFMGRSTDKVETSLRALKNLGITIALDDFGTGYSSLTHLKQFKVNIIKLDRSFVLDIDKDPEDAALVKAMVGLGLAMDLQIVAEGVETEEQHTFLKESGCQIAQGYLYSKPLTIDAAFEYLSDASFSRTQKMAV